VTDDALRERARYLDNDGALSRNDMLDLFSVVEQDGTVNYNEWASLGRMDDTGAFLGMPDSVHVLTHKTVRYDAGNKLYQGQTLESDGMLHAGDGADKLVKLVNKWFEGLDHPVAQNGDGTVTYSYAYANGVLFHNVVPVLQNVAARTVTGIGGIIWSFTAPDYTDVRQGTIGDCYYMSALAGAAKTKPQTIKDMFTDNGDGTYMVRLFISGHTDYVTVDRYLPVNGSGRFVYANMGGLASDTNNVLWAALAEKAYAQFNGSGTIGQDNTNSYQGLNGGNGATAITQITGIAADWHAFGDSGAGKNDLIAALNAGKIVTWSTLDDNPPNADVVPDHLYLVTGYDAATGKFQLFNPWGLAGGYHNGRFMPGTLSLTWQELNDNGYGWNSSRT
jgi:hypothetical protein